MGLRRLLPILAAAILGLAAVPPARLAGDDVADHVAGAQRLEALSQAGLLRALPAGPLNADADSVALLEYTAAAPYARYEPGGAPNYGARAAVARRFYEAHGENYDFLLVFTNFDFDSGGPFFTPVRNDVRGIGRPLLDLGAHFGSRGRLLGYADLGPLDRYRVGGFSLEPGTPGFQKTLNAVAHQMAHQWLAQVRYRDQGDALASRLLGLGGVHWSAGLDTDGSFLGGADWVDEGTGIFRAASVGKAFSELDLYLMGLVGPDQVAPLTLLRAPGLVAERTPTEGEVSPGPTETIDIGQITRADAEGPRLPDRFASPKAFRVGFVLLVDPETSPEEVRRQGQELAEVRKAYATYFFTHTRGLAIADTTLAEDPTPPLTVSPDLDRALAWLLSQQRLDGRFEDATSTGLRDTAAVLEALARAGLSAEVAFLRGRLWVQGATASNFDFLARQASARARGPLTETDRASLASSLASRQNALGGFGPAPGYATSALDTALALRAFASLGRPLDANLRRAFGALAGLQRPGGGWPIVPGGDVSTIVTAQVMLALQDWPQAPEAAPLSAGGLASLLAARNPDGGLGQSPSSTHATALALQVLVRAGAPAALALPPTAWLAERQLVDGSWEGSPYQTAIVVTALRASLAPNLVVPADQLSLVPPTPQEGESVTVTAMVRNEGRGPAGASLARLYDGSPTVGAEVASSPVPPLPAGGEALATFAYDTTDRAGTRSLFVLADAAGEVTESREDDNAASRAITVAGLLPDLVVGPADLVVSPYPPAEGEIAHVLVTVRNAGTKDAAASVLRLFRGDPHQGGTLLGQVNLRPLVPGEAESVDFSWDTTGVGQGTVLLVAVADATYVVREAGETNNTASRAVEVAGPPPSGPDLAVELLELRPARLTTLPATVELRAVIRNRGADQASAAVLIELDGETTRQDVDLASREAVTLTHRVEVDTPGPRPFVVTADPDDLLDEANEDNNQASIVLEDPGDTVDLEILSSEVALSSASLTIGEDLTVTVPVRNRGTRFSPPAPVAFYRVSEAGLVPLDQRLVSVTEGGLATLQFRWTADAVAAAVGFAVIADPEGALAEAREANNRADFTVSVGSSERANLVPVPGSLAIEPHPPQEDAPARVSVAVRNESPTVAAGAFAIRFMVEVPGEGETPIGEAPVSGLGPLETTTVALDWPRVTAGATVLAALVDAQDAVPEYEERDNRAGLALGVLGLPDLVLVASEVEVEPGAPRVAEAVRLLVRVRNRGGQPAGVSVLRAFDGDPGGTLIQEASVPALDPGGEAVVELSWTPGPPPGPRFLSFLVDPEDAVREGDDGNNLARRTVLVQDADLFFSDVYFSPNGDGVKDETTFGYRVGAPARVVVLGARGDVVRTFASLSGSESVTWDGRDEAGVVVPDGPYTFSVETETGARLGAAVAVVDTNRTSLFESERLDEVLLTKTCGLSGISGDTTVLPADDAVLVIVRTAFAGLRPGLARVSFAGQRLQVLVDSWFGFAEGPETAYFASNDAVSPDGREALFNRWPDLVAVDLTTGERRTLGPAGVARWSPDGRFIVVNPDGEERALVLARGGDLVGSLPGPGPWSWSPDSESLAAGNHVVQRDGSGFREIPVAIDGFSCEPDEFDCRLEYQGTEWLRDGRISTRLVRLRENDGFACEAAATLLIDPVTGSYVSVDHLSGCDNDAPSWSPDGSKLLYHVLRYQEPSYAPTRKLLYHVLRYQEPSYAPTRIATADGSRVLELSDSTLLRTPRGSAAYALQSPCLTVATSLRNLTVALEPSALPDDKGLLVRGTVADQNLDSFQLEYAKASEPGAWLPLGPTSDVPFVDDTLTVWVPPAPDTYLLRLRAADLAGNTKTVTEVVVWRPASLSLPALADISQDAFLISPNADGRIDRVTFNFRVLRPDPISVRITGPKRNPRDAAPGPTVDVFTLHPDAVGPGSFTWGNVGLADGRYTVFINDLAFRLDLDTTPPDIGWVYENLRPQVNRSRTGGVVMATRLFHVVDKNLLAWQATGAGITQSAGTLVLASGGSADVSQDDDRVAWLGADSEAAFEASDRAGNTSRRSITPVEEGLFLLDVYTGGFGPVLLTPIDEIRLVAFLPQATFHLGETIRRPAAKGETVRFEYQTLAGGGWSTAPPFPAENGSFVWSADFDALGLARGVQYRGRFVTESGFTSESFAFKIPTGENCSGFVGLNVEPLAASVDQARFQVSVTSATPEPVSILGVSVVARGSLGNVSNLFELRAGTVLEVRTPAPSCEPDRPESVTFELLLGDDVPPGLCVDLSREFPEECRGGNGNAIAVGQVFKACGEGSPGTVYLSVTGRSVRAATASVLMGSREVARFGVPGGPFGREFIADSAALPEGEIELTARLTAPEGALVAEGTGDGFIDRSPPQVEMLLPAEGAASCALPDASGRERIDLVTEVDDASPAALTRREERDGSGPWRPWFCEAVGNCPGATFPHAPGTPPPLPQAIPWDVTGLEEGEHSARLSVCDRSGYTRVVERRIQLVRRPPQVVVGRVEGGVFSPNGDGRVDAATVAARLFQDVRVDAFVRGPSGERVRLLANNEPAGPPERAFVWDGRTDGGVIVPDGDYVLVVIARDGCGRTTETRAELAVDTVAPAAAIVRPRGADTVQATVDVLGFALDPHFDGYELSVGAGDNPTDWIPVRSNPYAVPGSAGTPGLLGRWETPAMEGPYVMRLVARDAAGNEHENRVAVRVGTRAFLARFAASPEAFSPVAAPPGNQASVTFALELRGRLFLEVRDGLGGRVRRLLDPAGVVFEAGVENTVAWDGSLEVGGTAADGEYTAWVRVEDATGPGPSEERTSVLILDATPPVIALTQPTSGAHLSSESMVTGSIEDDRLTEYVLTALGPGGSLEIGRGHESRTAADLAPLSALADGAYTLTVEARDRASNRRVVSLPFVVDTVPPVALLLAPLEGAVLGGAAATVPLTATITDLNLDEWVLRVGAGEAPTVLDVVARGTSAGPGIALGRWTTSGLPDGPYTLLLEARDRAGNLTQTFRRVAIDRQPPSAALVVPADGSALGVSPTVTGTAADQHLDAWTLEAAPGPAASAFEWSAVARGAETVTNGPLGVWPLPADGVHTLRLTVSDRAGNTAIARSTVTVDTVPPSLPPAGLEASVEASAFAFAAAAPGSWASSARPTGAAGASPAPAREAQLTAAASPPRVVLRWRASTDPDVAGYRVFRNGLLLTPERLEAVVLVDTTPAEGEVFRYAVVAEDRAGNRGPEATVTIRVDTTPPLASLLQPVAGAELSGLLTVMGSAWSADDFRAYRLYFGRNEDPATWVLLRRSSLPVLAGPLGELDARGEGARVLVLEAEDASGNVNRVMVAVTIDNVPPLAPTLTAVEEDPFTYVTATWQGSASTDTAGYLVYRNGRLANASGLSLADLRTYLVPGPTYTDGSLPDGRQCFTVVAMDRAGNLSAPSASGCLELDNRPPAAWIATPANGSRFEQAVTVIAESDDSDLASVVFEIRAAGGGAWAPLETDSAEPFETVLDPVALALTAGSYELRARATDRGGRSDPTPLATTVVYGDTTPPAAPLGFVARVDGAFVRLSWTAGTEADLEGYRLYRNGALYRTGLTAPAHVDAGLSPGRYEYQVVSVDHDDNESPVSTTEVAIVYAVFLDPRFPVTASGAVDLGGSGARGDARVEIEREGIAIAQASLAVDRFEVPAVPLLAGPNVLRARGRDARDNASIPSAELVLISNAGPPALSGLEAVVSGHDVDLSWSPASDPDLQGYLVRRDGTLLTESQPQRETSSIEGAAAGPAFTADKAFDEDPATAWLPPVATEAAWTVTFPARVLVDAVSLEFAYGYSGGVFPWPVGAYRIEALHEGRFLPLVVVAGNGLVERRHEWPTAFATEAIRVVIAGTGFEALAEVRVSVLDVVPASATTFREEAPDGFHRYRVSAVDRYGFEGDAAEVERPVGDVEPPAAPTGLRGRAEGSDVHLEWDLALEPIDRYEVLRDGAPIGDAASATYIDPGRPNGTYRYAVRAFDAAGNGSLASDEILVTVEAALPAAPVLRGASSRAGHVVLDWEHLDAEAFQVWRSPSAGGPYELLATTANTRTHRDRGVLTGNDYFYVVRALDDFGNASADSGEVVVRPERTLPPSVPAILAPTLPGQPITVEAGETLLRGRADAGSTVGIVRNGTAAGTTAAVPDLRAFGLVGGLPLPEGRPDLVAPDGRTLALSSFDIDGLPRVSLLDLRLSTARPLDPATEGGVAALAFSPDGRKLVYAAFSMTGDSSRLLEVDLETLATRLLDEQPERIGAGSWATDGRSIAFVVEPVAGFPRLHVFDFLAGSSRVLWTSPGAVPRNPRHSPDGRRIAFLLERGVVDPELVVVEVASGSATVIPDPVIGGAVPAWSPDGRFIAYTSVSDGAIRIRTFEPASRALVTITDGSRPAVDPRFDPRESWLTFAEIDYFSTYAEFRALDLATGVTETVWVAPVDGSAPGRPVALNEWTSDGRLVLAWPGLASFLQAHDATFESPRLRLTLGDNQVSADATDPATSLGSGASDAVLLRVPESAVPDLVVEAGGATAYPAVPLAGRPATLSVLVRNAAPASAPASPVTLTVSDPTGALVLRSTGFLPDLAPGAAAAFSANWTPAAAGVYVLRAEADTGDRVAELREDNNATSRSVYVVAASGLQVVVETDREEYGAHTVALVRVRLTNAGPVFDGDLATVVEDEEGREAARLDARAVIIPYGETREWSFTWNTGLTYAGTYRFRSIVRDEGGGEVAGAAAAFRIVGQIAASARVVPDRATNPEGEPVSLAVRIENQSVNLPLTAFTARLQIAPLSGGPPAFETTLALPTIPPGSTFTGTVVWPASTPAGDYTTELVVARGGEPPVATASADFAVVSVDAFLSGVLILDPAQVLTGGAFQARATVTNRDDVPIVGRTLAVEIQAGSDFSVLVRGTAQIDLAPGASAEVVVPLDAPIPPGFYPVFLVAEGQFSLDRATLRVHGVIRPPSVDAPADGAKVATTNPVLSVNNAVSPDGQLLTYEFQLFTDAGLTMALAGAQDVPEEPGRTSWRVAYALGEDNRIYWRARATDGFSVSAWTEVVSFTVDLTNQPPSAPVAYRPLADDRMASLQPTLTVANAWDPEQAPLVYEFQIATDPETLSVVASATGLAEGPDQTSWTVPVSLDENTRYYWRARAYDGVALSSWMSALPFRVDLSNDPPPPPFIKAPGHGSEVETLTPALVVSNAADPEGDPLSYRFEVFREGEGLPFEISPAVPADASGETSWVPSLLEDNSLYAWRVTANDGALSGPPATAQFFVNLLNEPPGTPVAQEPVTGQIVTSATPLLRARNTTDPDRDALTYEFEVRDGAGAVVASAVGVAEGTVETTWRVDPPLAENQSFRWSVRARDEEGLPGLRSEPQAFRVNAVAEPPTTPVLVSPLEGATLAATPPTLVVANAVSPEGLALTYTLELYAAGTATPLQSAAGLPEGSGRTSWTPTVPLVDGDYTWRVQAVDSSGVPSLWMTAHFRLAVDQPPAPPAGVRATPGDARVLLEWTASPEPDVTGYQVYRAALSGGPYTLVASIPGPSYEDAPLPNGVTVLYVVTALDARFESAYSVEVAATPNAAPGLIPAEVEFVPERLPAECLLPTHGIGAESTGSDHSPQCPPWLFVSVELPTGYHPGSIDVSTVRLAGSIEPAHVYRPILDRDRDGRPELRLRFNLRRLTPLLHVGPNVLVLTASASAGPIRGEDTLVVAPPSVSLHVTPRNLSLRSSRLELRAQLTFAAHMAAAQVDLSSLRLNGQVPVHSVVSVEGHRLMVKFAGEALRAVFTEGGENVVRVSGTLRGLSFVGVDRITIAE